MNRTRALVCLGVAWVAACSPTGEPPVWRFPDGGAATANLGARPDARSDVRGEIEDIAADVLAATDAPGGMDAGADAPDVRDVAVDVRDAAVDADGGGAAIDAATGCAGGGRCIVEIAANRYLTCARTSDDNVFCWGENDYFQVDPGGQQTDVRAPMQVTGAGRTLLPASALGPGGRHVCVIGRATGEVLCQGHAVTAGLVELNSPATVRALTSGDVHSCALLSDGTAQCWGDNNLGQLGRSTPEPYGQPPGAVSGGDGRGALNDIVHLVAYGGSTCAVRRDGSPWCWGMNDGIENTGDAGHVSAPVRIAIPALAVGLQSPVAVGGHHLCVLASGDGGVAAGEVYCWGRNASGQLGQMRSGYSFMSGDRRPVRRAATSEVLRGVSQVAAGEGHTCALVEGTVLCWGANEHGQVGVPTPTAVNGAAEVPGLARVRQIALGYQHTCALRDDGAMFCWGDNTHGQLGVSGAPGGVALQRVVLPVP